jgi:hypothetical protein
LIQTLKDHKTLERVDLGDNKNIGENGMNMLAEILKTKFALSRLKIKRKNKE